MKQQKTTILTMFIMLSFTISSLYAQVTVGIDKPAEKAALLQIKNVEVGTPSSVTDLSNATVDENGGGLALPRVHLENKNTLQPFISTLSMDWGEAAVNKIKEKHAGLMVYNLTTTGDFKQGVYVWDGTQWNLAGDGASSIAPTIDAWLKSGNAGTSRTTNFVGTTDAQGLSLRTNSTERLYISETGNVGVGVAAPTSKLHVDGTLTATGATSLGSTLAVTGATTLGNTLAVTGATNLGSTLTVATATPMTGEVMMRNSSTGLVGVALPTAPIAKAAFIQNKSTYVLSTTETTSLNASNTFTVPFLNTDLTNYGLGTLVSNVFTFTVAALCEVSGFLNYCPTSPIPSGTLSSANVNTFYATLNVTIQYSTNNGSTWSDLAAARGLWDMASMHVAQMTISIPPAIREFAAGDKLRMVIMRPAGYGTTHGATQTPILGIPTGSQFSRGMKISTL